MGNFEQSETKISEVIEKMFWVMGALVTQISGSLWTILCIASFVQLHKGRRHRQVLKKLYFPFTIPMCSEQYHL